MCSSAIDPSIADGYRKSTISFEGLNYEVFLDQYNLAAAASLSGLSLGEALDASQAAIMMWSSTFDDSKW